MRIAFYSHYFSPEIGAPSARVHEMSKCWLDAGHEVQVMTGFPNHPHGQLYPGYQQGWSMEEQMDGISVRRHWTYRTPNRGFIKRSLGHLSYFPSALLISNRRALPAHVCIGTSPTFFAAMAAAAAARRWNAPFIMDVRDLWPAIFVDLGIIKNRLIIKWLEKWEKTLYRRAARIVTVTEAFRENLIARGIASHKVVTVPNGADTDFFSPRPRNSVLTQKLGLQEKFVVGYLGTHGISHSLDTVLKAARGIKAADKVAFVFVGTGAQKGSLITQAKEMGLSNVHFLDPVEKSQVPDYYALFDLCVVSLKAVPLFHSFIPSKIFEIMASGRPILAGVKGETADILKRSGAARLVEPGDSRAFAEAVSDLSKSPGRLRTMALAGRDFVCRHYSRRRLAERYLNVLADARRGYGAGVEP